MGKGAKIPALTAAQNQQIALQNQLLQAQVSDVQRQMADYNAKNTPEYLQALENQSNFDKYQADYTGYNKARAGNYSQAQANATAALRSAGLDELIPQVLKEIETDYNNLGYTGAYTKDQGLTQNTADANALLTRDYTSGRINEQRAGRRDAAYNTAATTGRSRLEGMGLQDLLDEYDAKLNDTKINAGLSANTYNDIFDADTLVDSVLNSERSNKRQQYGTAVNKAFSGANPLLDFSDTADDSYINDIVSNQYGDAFGALERAKARGSLNQTGYARGLEELGNKRSAAVTTANTLGGAVLDRYRNDLSGIQNQAKTKAGEWDFGQSFNADDFLNQYNTKKSSFTEGLGGEINNALAGQNFFDVGSILNTAGYAQGAQNTAPLASGFLTPAAAALAGQRNKSNAATRGIGGGSTF